MARQSPMADLYRRLTEVGFPPSYVRGLVLPEWWEDELAGEEENRRLAEMAISRTLKISLASLAEPQAHLTLEEERTARFKRWQAVDGRQLLPSVVVARRVCELLFACADVPDLQLEGRTAEVLREQILRREPYVTLTPLVQHCWKLGVPVVHLENLPAGARRLDGLALMVSGRPCIVLASSRQSPAWLVWHLAHEVGHVGHGHVRRSDITIDLEIDFDAESQEEREANSYAETLVYGGWSGFRSASALPPAALAEQAREQGPVHRVHPACLITSYGFNMKAYDVANAALKVVGVGKGGAETLRAELASRIHLERLSETDRHFFTSVTGLME